MSCHSVTVEGERFRSKKEAVAVLSERGLTPPVIANLMNLPVSTIHAHRSYIRGQGGNIKRASRNLDDGWKVRFAPEIPDRIKPHAEARKCTPSELIRRLIDAALDDDMIGAILDDGVKL